MSSTVDLGEFVLISQSDLAPLVIEVPGDGPRILMAIISIPDYSGPDGVSIIAMADDLPTLTARTQAAGLHIRIVTTRYGENAPIEKTDFHVNADEPEVRPGLHTNTYDAEVTVLDLPPYAVCNLSLSSPAAMLDSIQVMKEKSEKASGGLTSSFGF